MTYSPHTCGAPPTLVLPHQSCGNTYVQTRKINMASLYSSSVEYNDKNPRSKIKSWFLWFCLKWSWVGHMFWMAKSKISALPTPPSLMSQVGKNATLLEVVIGRAHLTYGQIENFSLANASIWHESRWQECDLWSWVGNMFLDCQIINFNLTNPSLNKSRWQKWIEML